MSDSSRPEDHYVIVALDFADAESGLVFARQLDPKRCALKVGFELFVAAGPALVEALVTQGFRVFLNLKFHDIPNTVASACAAASELGVWMVNVHASGGPKMIEAAREALDRQVTTASPLLIAVTVLTSMDQATLQQIGVAGKLPEVVNHWATMAANHGCDGVVCSAQEVAAIRDQNKAGFLTVTPGIRLPEDAKDDQHRIFTPAQAQQVGVSHIVVGRPITRAQDPQAALMKFYTAFTGA